MNTASESTLGPTKPIPTVSLAILIGLVGILCYSFYNSLSRLWLVFWNTDEYSHGYIVPVIAAVLLYMRWKPEYLESLRNIAPSAKIW